MNDDTTFAAHEPVALAARRAWYIAGAHGHYPGCPCDQCIARNRYRHEEDT